MYEHTRSTRTERNRHGLRALAFGLGATTLAFIGSPSATLEAQQPTPAAVSTAESGTSPSISATMLTLDGAIAVNQSALAKAAEVAEARKQRAVSRALERKKLAERERCWDGDSSDFNSTEKEYYKYIYRACELAEGQPWAEEDFSAQMDALISLWDRESGWNPTLKNAEGSSAYGIPQALPGSKMGKGWQDDPDVQIKWGLKYVTQRYGTPINAWQFFKENNWY